MLAGTRRGIDRVTRIATRIGASESLISIVLLAYCFKALVIKAFTIVATKKSRHFATWSTCRDLLTNSDFFLPAQ